MRVSCLWSKEARIITQLQQLRGRTDKEQYKQYIKNGGKVCGCEGALMPLSLSCCRGR